MQSRITEALYGRDMAAMEEVIDRDELKGEFKTLDPKLQRLSLKPGTLADPDDQSSATVYTKGVVPAVPGEALRSRGVRSRG